MPLLDDNGQPIHCFRSRQVEARTVDELIGICKAIVADDAVSPAEADFLCAWLEGNRAVADVWPVSALNERIRGMLEGGGIGPAERSELLETLKQLIGGRPAHEHVASFASTLPLDSPPPDVFFPGKRFCLTGRFAFGPREACLAQIMERGGLIEKGIKRNLDYLIIGLIGSRDWTHSTYGAKIEKAVAYRTKGVPLAIVGEDHWASFL
jgi:hypothetical protein